MYAKKGRSNVGSFKKNPVAWIKLFEETKPKPPEKNMATLPQKKLNEPPDRRPYLNISFHKPSAHWRA